MTLEVIRKQRGSISLLGAMAMLASFTSLYMVLELGNKMIEDRNFDNYAKSLAPVALRSELAITEEMIAQGTAVSAKSVVESYLEKIGLSANKDVTVKVTFGNMVGTDAGNNGEASEIFTPLEANAESPKLGTVAGNMPAVFSAVKVELTSQGGLLNFHPQGIAVYGLSNDGQEDSNISACYCDLRYESCLQADAGSYASEMGNIGSSKRKTYCETGYAPVKSSFFGMFKDKKYHSVNLSPQWVGKPYENELAQVFTDQTTSQWQTISNNQPLNVSSGQNPFPLASWQPSTTQWITPAQPLVDDKNNSVSGRFYVGRTGTCADTSGFFFTDMMNAMMGKFGADTDCLVYDGDLNYHRDYPKLVQGYVDFMASVTGANEYYYSCYDFTGIKQARSGFIQWFTRLWTSPLVDWNQSYGETGCVATTMRWFGPECFGH